MKPKFSPGPWKTDPSQLIVFSPQGLAIADVAGTAVEDKANAQLISCAPDMHDLLQSIVDKNSFSPDDLYNAKFILAKARGDT